MRAAYAAIVLGLIGGLALATGVLSGRAGPPPATVAATLAMDRPGVDLERRRAEAVAVLVARCMLRRGVIWIPWIDPPPSIPDPELGPIDWARRWGFGVSTTAGHGAAVAPADPNLAAAGSLAPDDRHVLWDALRGRGLEPGCQTGANDAVYGLRARLMAPIRPMLDELDARIAADPAAVRALDVWRDCVRPVASGLALDRRTLPTALIARITDRLATVGTGAGGVAAMAAIQAEERRTATILASCEAAFADDRAAAAAPHEASFVGDHRAELERIGAAIRAAEAMLPTLPP